MAAITNGEYSVSAAGDIRVDTLVGNHTVLELHRWLQDLADNANETSDDFMSIIRKTPSQRSTDNIITLVAHGTPGAGTAADPVYNIDDATAQTLYNGSIIQNNGEDIYDGVVNFGNVEHIEILQNGTLIANDFWNLGGAGINADAAAGISHQFMVKTVNGGSDIDNRRLLGLAREWNKTYSEFNISQTSRGNNVLALSEFDDLNNQNTTVTVGGWSADFTNTEGYQTEDLLNGNGAQPYYSGWDIGASRDENDLYEYVKYITRRGETSNYYGIQGQIFRGITHEIEVDNQSATDWSAVEAVSWTGGTGQMIAVDDLNASTKMWIQLLTGVPPTDGQTITGGTSGATADVNVTVTSRTISTPSIGASTGSAIIGGYGFGILVGDIDENSTLTDLNAAAQSKPSTGTAAVDGVVVSEDRLLVCEADGSDFNYNQMALNTALTTGSETSVVIGNAAGDNLTIPADTPDSPIAGKTVLRITTNAGRVVRVPYTTHNGTTTFTIPSFDFSGDNASIGNGVMVGYIDKVAGSTEETVDLVNAIGRTMYVRVRDGGGTPIVTYEAPLTFASTGKSTATVIRTSDA